MIYQWGRSTYPTKDTLDGVGVFSDSDTTQANFLHPKQLVKGEGKSISEITMKGVMFEMTKTKRTQYNISDASLGNNSTNLD